MGGLYGQCTIMNMNKNLIFCYIFYRVATISVWYMMDGLLLRYHFICKCITFIPRSYIEKFYDLCWQYFETVFKRKCCLLAGVLLFGKFVVHIGFLILLFVRTRMLLEMWNYYIHLVKMRLLNKWWGNKW